MSIHHDDMFFFECDIVFFGNFLQNIVLTNSSKHLSVGVCLSLKNERLSTESIKNLLFVLYGFSAFLFLLFFLTFQILFFLWSETFCETFGNQEVACVAIADIFYFSLVSNIGDEL